MPGTRDNQAGEANKSKAMSEDLKIAMGLIESLYPEFKLKNWQAIADENRNSLATVKQRFPKTIDKYKEASQGDLNTPNSTSVPVAAAPRPPQAPVEGTQRNLNRTAPDEYEDEEHDDESMPPPPPPKRARRSTRSTTKDQTVSGTDEDSMPPPPTPKRASRNTQSNTKEQTVSDTDEDLYETNLLKYGGPRGWPVPVDDTFKEWIFPGEGRKEARENYLREQRELAEIYARQAKEKNGQTPTPSLGSSHDRKEARSRLCRGCKHGGKQRKEDEKQE
ncbi:hypothetical protein PG985_012751 [Apiospora marii]|uniref:uncharacterized protein n=1 Tax=Apiospora marii TaxID=335849 RepID=UPI00312F6DDF